MTIDVNEFFARLRTESPKASYPESECSTLSSYLNGEIDAHQCATEVTQYTNRRLPVASKLCTWTLIIQLGLKYAEAHDDLIALIKEIRSIPASKDAGGIDWTKETQSFGEAFRSLYDSTRGELINAEQAGGQNATPGQLKITQQWTNINTFDAKLQHTGLSDDLLNGLLLIARTLEKERTPAQVHMNLGATAAWLEFASKEIKDGAVGVGAHIDWAQESESKKGIQVDGKRLAFWEEQLEDLSDSSYIGEELVAACERATSAIEQALWEKKR